MRAALTAAAVACFAAGVNTGFSAAGGVAAHFTYQFAHANVFHLLGNLFCLWLLRGRLHPAGSYALSVACSFLPCLCAAPTVGMSGLLMAEVGIRWGKAARIGGMCKAVLPPLLLCGLLPGVNMMIHVYCLFAGYALAFAFKKYGKGRRYTGTH